MKFMRAQDGTAFNVDQIVSVGPAAVIRQSKGFGPYLMASLADGRMVIPFHVDTKTAWPAEALDDFLRFIAAQ